MTNITENIMSKLYPLSKSLVKSNKIRNLSGGFSGSDDISIEYINEPDWKKIRNIQFFICICRAIQLLSVGNGTAISYICQRADIVGKINDIASIFNPIELSTTVPLKEPSISDTGSDFPEEPQSGGGLGLCNTSNAVTSVVSAASLAASLWLLNAKLRELSPYSETRFLYNAGTGMITLGCVCSGLMGFFNVESFISNNGFKYVFSLGNNFFKSLFLMVGSLFTVGTLFYLLGTAFDWGEIPKDSPIYEELRSTYARVFAVQLLVLFVSLWSLIASITNAHSVSNTPTFVHNITQPLIFGTFAISGAFEIKDLLAYHKTVKDMESMNQ